MENETWVGLKFVLVEIGVQSVMNFGKMKMQVLHVGSLVSPNMVRSHDACTYLIILKHHNQIQVQLQLKVAIRRTVYPCT